MPILTKIQFSHYAPKDSEDGIKEFVISDTLEQVVLYVDKEHLFNYLFGENYDENKDEECSLTLTKGFLDNPEKKNQLEQHNLALKEWGGTMSPDVVGTARNITLWLEANNWQDFDDASYGVTQWDWSNHQEISQAEAEVLLNLKIAKDIRN